MTLYKNICRFHAFTAKNEFRNVSKVLSIDFKTALKMLKFADFFLRLRTTELRSLLKRIHTKLLERLQKNWTLYIQLSFSICIKWESSKAWRKGFSTVKGKPKLLLCISIAQKMHYDMRWKNTSLQLYTAAFTQWQNIDKTL